MKFSLTILSFASIVAVAAQSAANTTASDSAAASSSNSTAADTTSSDSPSSTGSSGSSFAVPSGISSSCSSFLQSLDTESAIQSCVSPALVALEDSNPTLASVCASTASSTCSEDDYYQALSNFSSSCADELITSPNANVTAIYDSLYVALPFQKAVCTQDNLNNWCAQGNATNTDASGASANSAQSPLSTSDGYPDAEAFASDDILFLGYNANMDASSLCTTCLQKVLTVYFGHESKRPYPSGLSGSPLLSVQSALWSAVQTKCPSDFVTSAISNAGASPSSVNAAAAFSPAKGATVLLALFAGVLVL